MIQYFIGGRNMIVGYIYQPVPSDKLLSCFEDGTMFVEDSVSVVKTITDIVLEHKQQIQEKSNELKAQGCQKFSIKSNQNKEIAWNDFYQDLPEKTYVIVSSFDQITDSIWKLNNIIKDAIEKQIYILDIENAMISQLSIESAHKYYEKLVLKVLSDKERSKKAQATIDKIVDLSLKKYNVNQIMEMTGASRSTVFRARRISGIKERFYNI